MKVLKRYLYIDKDGIDSILAQIEDELVIEQSVQQGTSIKGGISASIGLSNLLKSFFQADVKSNIETTNNSLTIAKLAVTYEQRINKVIQYCKTNENYYCDIDTAVNSIHDNEDCFLDCQCTFHTRNYYNSYEGIKLVSKMGYVLFERGHKSPSDEYSYKPFFDDLKYYYESAFSDGIYDKRIIMNMGIEKMNGHFGGVTSHFSTFIRMHDGLNVPLGVFGHLRNIQNKFYQIKPYAVWW